MIAPPAPSELSFHDDAVEVDRGSDRWLRLRAAVGDGHAIYVDADAHTDSVVRLLLSATTRRRPTS